MSNDSKSESSQLWASLLKSAGTVSSPPTASLLLLGPSQNSQTQLISRIQTVSKDSNCPKIANQFGLGYTYVDFKDDNDDKLSHLDIYTLENKILEVDDVQIDGNKLDTELRVLQEEEVSKAKEANQSNQSEDNQENQPLDESVIEGESESITTNSLFIQKHSTTIQYMNQVFSRVESQNQPLLVGLVLDWNDDIRSWASNIRDWIELLKECTRSFDNQGRIEDIKSRIQTYSVPVGGTGVVKSNLNTSGDGASSSTGKTTTTPSTATPTPSSSLPIQLLLEKGQYDSPLGFDLIIITIGSEKLTASSTLSTSSSDIYSEDNIDFIQQYLRTIALKHGASVVYTPYFPDIPFEGLTDIISERLQIPIHEQKQFQRAIPNIVDNDKLIVPSGWDSQGKILAVKEGFPIEEVSNNWMKKSTAIKIYETTLTNELSPSPKKQIKPTELIDFQEVLKNHYNSIKNETPPTPQKQSQVGGIQLETVEEMVKRLNIHEIPTTPERSRTGEKSESTTPNSTNQNKVLANFFQHLLTKHQKSPE